MSLNEKNQPLSRADFLRLAAVGAGGLGLAAVAGCGKKAEEITGQVAAIIHGPDDPDKVILALVMAQAFPPGDNYVFFALDGGKICKKEEAEKVSSKVFPEPRYTADQLIADIRAKGTRLVI